MNPKKLAVITSFPQKGITHDKIVVGIASYAKNTLLALEEQSDIQITVLAEKFNNKKEEYEDKGILVKRIWQRNSILIFPSLLKQVFSLGKDTNNVLIEFEVSMFGNFVYLIPFPIFLLILRLMGKKITVVSHQVITDIKDLSGHINLQSKIYPLFLNIIIGAFYRLVLLEASNIIVFDKVLKDKLSKFGNMSKIKVIPHGVEEFKSDISKDKAREKLSLNQNDFIVLYFGFLAWYKGVDWLVKAWDVNKLSDKGIKLIIAGGPNPNHSDKKYYHEYIENVRKICEEKGILLTGFVNESNIPDYFNAADVVALPYRTLMSSSGPLSIAFSFKKPFIVSKSLEGIFLTDDLEKTLKTNDLLKEDLIFNSYDQFNNLSNKLKTDTEFRDKVVSVSSQIGTIRKWNKIGKRYYEEIFS